MRRGSLLWIWPVVACTAETGGLEAQAGSDAGGVLLDTSVAVDSGASDLGSPADLGAPPDSGVPLDGCPAWVDQTIGGGAQLQQAPLLLRDGESVRVVWTTTTGIEVATLGSTLQLEDRQRLGGPRASDVNLLTYDGRPHVVWVENSSTANQLYDAELNGRVVSHVLGGGEVRHRISAAVGTMDGLLVVATNGAATAILRLDPQLLQFFVGRLHFDLPIFDPGDSGPPITLSAGGNGMAFLAWLTADGIYAAELTDGGVYALGPALVDPNGGTFIPGFQVLHRVLAGGQETFRLLVNDFGDRRASVHFYDLLAPNDHTLVQRHAGGISEYSSTAVWVPGLSSYVVAWPDFRESFSAEGYYGRRRIYATRLDETGAFQLTDAQGGHPDLPLSPPLTQDALRPSLLSLGGDRLLLAYLTDDGAVHLSSGALSCLEPVADLNP
ncbi:MAG: hypothetical protein IPG45_29305 [Deltaproteobacteria bacterium]|nr:hypothetical protein [Deltaproteobacteria bacterium]